MSVSKYWREIPHRYRLEAGQCQNCQYVCFPKRLVCPECGSKDFKNIQLPREGKLITYTIIHIAPSKFTDQVPYAVGIVELNQKVRILCQITDCSLDKIKTGMSLRIEFRRISEEGEAGIINYGYKCVPLFN
jgi:uncharacterized OB-fold protein